MVLGFVVCVALPSNVPLTTKVPALLAPAEESFLFLELLGVPLLQSSNLCNSSKKAPKSFHFSQQPQLCFSITALAVKAPPRTLREV